MIKFFRKIRQQLLSQNNVSKYLLYAIGEIVLVVIGILIALQINNWNENKKDIAKSSDILLEIKENIQFNNLRFEADIKEERSVINSIDIVFENINEYKVYNDSLDFHFINTTYYPTASRKSSGYETLKSQGVELIKSNKLRQGIIDLYEKTYNEISDVARESGVIHDINIIPLFTELFLTHPSIPNQPFEKMGATPFDYDKVVHSQRFRGILSFWRHSRTVAIQLRQNAISENNELVDAIIKEIEEK
ncbi:DUF6090 family protein [Eudoraea adriatica]|uniref:DUF6090 family protein n=1 Tax=Eudoraea adriatica TaxID=446681 RepID=UPI00036493B2|nr:DUF6090 family protein [Eudoraea adriatica]